MALAFLVSLMLAGQVVTGFLIWWKPGRLAAGTTRKTVVSSRKRGET